MPDLLLLLRHAGHLREAARRDILEAAWFTAALAVAAFNGHLPELPRLLKLKAKSQADPGVTTVEHAAKWQAWAQTRAQAKA